ncbi:hypothetical protein M9458_008363, partial [Cirrhinus mrigala]
YQSDWPATHHRMKLVPSSRTSFQMDRKNQLPLPQEHWAKQSKIMLKLKERHSVVEKAQGKLGQRRQAHAKDRTFAVGDRVLVRDYRRGKKWMPGVVSVKTGPVSYTVDVGLSVHWRRHVDQMLAHQNDCDNGDEMGPVTIDVPGGNLTDSGECPMSGEALDPSLDPVPTESAQLKDSSTRDTEVVLHTPPKETKRYPERNVKPPVR